MSADDKTKTPFMGNLVSSSLPSLSWKDSSGGPNTVPPGLKHMIMVDRMNYSYLSL